MGALDLSAESAAAQHGHAKLNVEGYAPGLLLSDGDCSNPDDYERVQKGIMQYGYVLL
jgi:RING finger and CHY zinc finger domain-containing protein 1